MKTWDLIGLTFGVLVCLFYLYDKFKNKTPKIRKAKINYTKYGINKEILERLADYEQARKPGLSRDKAKEWALNRIERDNR